MYAPTERGFLRNSNKSKYWILSFFTIGHRYTRKKVNQSFVQDLSQVLFVYLLKIISSMSKLSVAELNDMFRSGKSEIEIPGKVVMTNGVSSMGEEAVQKIIEAVQSFNNFTPENDPYGEHDFGKIIYDETSIYFKIDYYDPSLQYHSEDKTDLEKTVRVMTIMLASEY